jgi:carbamate kinase
MRIVELAVIKQLLDAGVATIAVGGGGIPVVTNEAGDLEGIAAVIDKDLASALLASQVDADLLLISTAVEQVAINFGKPNEEWVSQFTVAEVKQYLAEGSHFAEGSMAPKMRAVVQFMEAGGKEALITNPQNLERAMAGETGTRIVQ